MHQFAKNARYEPCNRRYLPDIAAYSAENGTGDIPVPQFIICIISAYNFTEIRDPGSCQTSSVGSGSDARI